MPRIDLTLLIRDLALEPVPVAATIKVQARDACGPYVSVDGDKVVFSRQRDIVLRPGQPQQIDVPPTDGAHFCWISVAVGAVEREWTLSVPDTTDVVPFGALVKVNPETYQPTEDVLAEWDILRQDSYRARADAVAASGVAEGHASDAAGSAGAAAGSAGSAASSAGDAAGSAGSAAGSSGDAAGFAGAASESAGQASGAAGRASDSASAAAESERKAGLSASAAATSAGTADTKAGEASLSAGQAGQAKTAAEAARDLALVGQFAGSPLGTADLNTIQTPGVYRQGASASLALNYPAVLLGNLIVYRAAGPVAGDWLTQEYHPVDNNTGRAGRIFYRRVKFDATWGAWRSYPSLRVNKPAGQPGSELFLWNEATGVDNQLMPVNTALGTTSLDAVFADGLYYQDNSANVTTANGYPTTGGAGLLRVSRRNSDSFVVQEYVALSATATQSAQTFIRRRVNGAWAAWQQVQTGYTDTSVGRRLFVNDEVNGRPQMVYGDTGWRDVGGLLINGWSAAANNVLMRRYGATVMLKLIGIDRTNSTSDAFLNSITGFRNPNGQGWWPYARSDGSISYMREQGGILNLVARTVGTGAQTYATFQWLTDDAWPTSLPGNAYGVIPVN